MDDEQSSVANRDEAIPVFRLPSQQESEPNDPTLGSASASDADADAHAEGQQHDGARERLRDHAQKVKSKWDEYGVGQTRQSLQDRFLTGLMSRIVPPEEVSEDEGDGDNNDGMGRKEGKRKDRRSSEYVDRPNFSIPLMSANFRRFNARVGVLFVLENRLIHLFTWKHPTATLSFLAAFTLLCLQPYLLPVVPLIGTLFWVMIPSFLARHPPPTTDGRFESSYLGPPIAPPSRVKPAPEMSKDFFRNMRDLQNSMEDFSRLHDVANEYVTPYTNFSDEGVSSLLFMCLFGVTCSAFIASGLVPWRAVALLAGWLATILGHPEAQKVILSPKGLSQLGQRLETLATHILNFVSYDIILDERSEARQVEIFELQKYHPYSDTWESWLFSCSPYDPLSPSRIAGDRAKGTQFFEDVSPPPGWSWKDKKWILDLFSRDWVEQRMIHGVEIETEGERWVYDLPKDKVEQLAGASSHVKSKGGGRSKGTREIPKSGWEEGGVAEGMGRGDWRRRRWVRTVERRPSADVG
ncbi:hypothetical protein B0A50_05297 [Salinomyces thailandicus]|uniref:TECPR1-like DysF domain-containing protein n=1 Tax=Salinomyces thailandicus TaxID=706561 RepID=A0A4U0TVS1_9PEZI|nr:hypothetical protein B0A50_05297 [Salinomyces thailandica]